MWIKCFIFCLIFNQVLGFDHPFIRQDSISNQKFKSEFKSIQLIKNEKMRFLMEKINKEDPEMGLMIMFSMDFLYLSHPCFCEFLEKDFVSPEKFLLLEEEIKKF